MNKKFSVDALAKAGMLTALSIILSRYLGFFITPTMKVSFGTLPLIISGMMLGPIMGGLSGVASDLIGVMINAGGTPHLGFTLGALLTGAVPGLISLYCKNKKIDLKFEVLFIIIFVYLISHTLLTPLWLSQLYGTPYKVLLISRMPKVLIDAIINYILLYFVASKILPRVK